MAIRQFKCTKIGFKLFDIMGFMLIYRLDEKFILMYLQ